MSFWIQLIRLEQNTDKRAHCLVVIHNLPCTSGSVESRGLIITSLTTPVTKTNVLFSSASHFLTAASYLRSATVVTFTFLSWPHPHAPQNVRAHVYWRQTLQMFRPPQVSAVVSLVSGCPSGGNRKWVNFLLLLMRQGGNRSSGVFTLYCYKPPHSH